MDWKSWCGANDHGRSINENRFNSRRSRATALSLLAAAAVVSQSTGVAAAQNVVTTQKYVIGNGSVTDATAVAQPDTRCVGGRLWFSLWTTP